MAELSGPQKYIELKIGRLLPFFVVLSFFLIIGIVPSINLRGFGLAIPVHASSHSNYSRDPLNLSFAPVDPEIITDAQNDQTLMPFN